MRTRLGAVDPPSGVEDSTMSRLREERKARLVPSTSIDVAMEVVSAASQ
jgi:hypothetical protein